jgi:coniferyl-aldehyde dehydrogenase
MDSPGDVQTTLTQTLAQLRQAWLRQRPDYRQRRDDLRRLRVVFKTRIGAMSEAIAADFGHRSHHESVIADGMTVTGEIDHLLAHLRGWMKPERVGVGWRFWPARAQVRPLPVGVVGVISPWNYPVNLALVPLATAIAAGNHVLLKPSEHTPQTSAFLQSLLAEVFPPERVRVVQGDATVAAAFSALPLDHLVFTGSTAVGRKVMAAAAQHLTPLTLELGGKSPAVVAPDYPLDKAARSIAFGKFLNAGQTCIAPDYALVPAGQVRPFAEAVLDQARRAYPTLQDNPDYSGVISDRHRLRLREAVAAARAAGAEVLEHPDAGDGNNGKIAPTLVLNPPSDGLLMQEEIFGPVLPVVGYDSLDEALAFVAARPRPLALYGFTNQARTRDRILGSGLSGGATLNGTMLHIAQNDLPFGGVGPSGLGAYHGPEGFKRFSHARAVYDVGPVNAFERLGPPWDGAAGRLARAALRFLAR